MAIATVFTLHSFAAPDVNKSAGESIPPQDCTGTLTVKHGQVTINGRHEARRVQIEPAVAGEDREMLEDLIAAAVNDAVHKVEAQIAEKMAAVTAGMQLPPGLKLPF